MSADELDVDAELLAMGGDSSDDESDAGGEVAESTQVIESLRTPSEEPKPSVENVAAEEPPSARRGVAMKVRKNRRKRVTRKEIEDELDDLGDGSSSPARSIASDSAGSADAPGSPADIDLDDGPLYPLEGQFLSAADKAEILALPEIERESILASREDEKIRRNQDIQLKRQLAASEAAASKFRKRKAAAADLGDEDGGGRKSSRPKLEKAGRSALDDYKKAREAKGAERSSRFDAGRRDPRHRSRSRSSAGSDRDADGESEVEWAEPISRRDKDEPSADLKDFDRCRIGRSAFAKVCFYPNFEETMKGCFARVSIGMNRETGENMYRMTQIKGFHQGKPYTLDPGPNKKPFQTDQYALVAHGSAEKPWPFSACSDSPFTLAELDRYTSTLEKERIRLPRKGWLVQKLDDLHKFLDPKWDETALGTKFRKQREMEKRVDPANAAKVKREAVEKKIREAEENGADEEEVSRLEAELAALGGSQKRDDAVSESANGISSSKPPKSSPLKAGAAAATAAGHGNQDRLALLNQKNRGKNADDVRKALLEERKKLQREREKALAEAKAKAEAAAAEAERKKAESLLAPNYSDLFGDISDISRAGTPMSGISTPKMRRSRAGTPVNGVGGPTGGKKEKSGIGMVIGDKKKKKVDDELGGLDLGIDVEI